MATVNILASGPGLDWDDNPAAEGVLSYKVYEKSGSTYNLIGSPVSSNFSLTGVVGPKTYAVSAVNVAGEGPRSADAIFPAAPSAPTNLKVVLNP